MTLTGLHTMLPMLATLLAYYLDSPDASDDIMSVKEMIHQFIDGKYGEVDEVEIAQVFETKVATVDTPGQIRANICTGAIVKCLEVHSMAQHRLLLFVVEVNL